MNRPGKSNLLSLFSLFSSDFIFLICSNETQVNLHNDRQVLAPQISQVHFVVAHSLNHTVCRLGTSMSKAAFCQVHNLALYPNNSRVWYPVHHLSNNREIRAVFRSVGSDSRPLDHNSSSNISRQRHYNNSNNQMARPP